jgi:hypothetical protein
MKGDAYVETKRAQQIQESQQQSQQGISTPDTSIGPLTIPDGKQQSDQIELHDGTKERGWPQSVLKELRD